MTLRHVQIRGLEMQCGRYYLRLSWIFLLVWFVCVLGCPTPSTATPPQALSEMVVRHEQGQWCVVLTGTRSMTYRAIKAGDPLRLVVDLPNTLNEMHPTPMTVNDEVIGTIRIVQLVHGPQPLTRVEIGLKQDMAYKITRQGKELWISFDRDHPVTNVEPTRPEPVVKSKAQQLRVTQQEATPKPSPGEAIPPPQPSGKKSPPSASKVLSIHRLKMDRELRYYIIADGSLADHVAFHLTNPPRLVLDLMGVKSTEVKDGLSFSGPWVRRVRVGQYTTKVRVVFDLIPEAGLPYQIISGDDRLVVAFKAGTRFPPR